VEAAVSGWEEGLSENEWLSDKVEREGLTKISFTQDRQRRVR